MTLTTAVEAFGTHSPFLILLVVVSILLDVET